MRSVVDRSVVVIGSGIAGASTTFWLTERGIKPTLIEKEYPAAGPTGRSTAILHAFYLKPELSRLAGRGTDILRHLGELTGGDAGFRAVGMLRAGGPERVAEWTASVDRIRADGYEIEMLSRDGYEDLAPGFIGDGIAGAVWEPTCGYADPSAATASLVEAAKARGADVRLHNQVKRLVVESGRVQGVELATGERLAADVVVLAVGPWTGPFLGQLGIELPLHVERRPMAVLDAPERARELLPFCWSDDSLRYYGRPEGKDLILVGPGRGIPSLPFLSLGGRTDKDHPGADLPATRPDPDRYEENITLAEAAVIVSAILPRAPQIASLGIRRGYAGLYDMSPDDNPLIGPIPDIEGLYVIAGSSGHGFKLGPAVGEEIARLILTGTSDLLEPFRVNRFGSDRTTTVPGR